MTLLRAASLSLAFGSRTVFHDLTLVIEEGERVGLIGVNGSGKSSLMKILAGAMPPDTGELQLRREARVTYLPQEPLFAPGATIESELSAANPALRDALAAHDALSRRLERGPAGERDLEQLADLSHRIEQLGGWDTGHEARTLLDRLGVKEWDRPLDDLSGGTRKRVAVARALLTRPDLLLLDEPTNHLDADTVDWLEEELDRLSGALLLVTHDRYFLDDLVDRIVEISPGEGLGSYPGNYQAFLEAKETEREQDELSAHKRERWIAQEVAWLRRAPEARRTKSKARIERARKLMGEKGLARKETAGLQTAAAPRLGHTVIEARGVGKSFDGRRVIEGVELILQRGERIGIVGRNGAGKTTFLRVLLGELPPDQGEVVIGKNTRVAYYDQQRAQLDPEWTVYESALGERIRGDVRQSEDYVELSGRRVALRDYLDDLLFPVPVQKMQVKALSGGERNRLLLARLFLQGANVLVLDEPTNDLDLVTLNVLEQLLLQFTGSVLLVTHDRYFLDKVATSILAFDGEGHAVRYPGNYETYTALRPAPGGVAAAAVKSAAPEKRAKPRKAGKLSFKEQRELESIESLIEAAEAAKAAAEKSLSDPQTYAREPHRIAELQREMERSSAEADRLYARWQELQDLQRSSE
ncbi:MAG: ABC-F family ATP-binding cassette domain-containing protein [Myxococcales bacterium]